MNESDSGLLRFQAHVRTRRDSSMRIRQRPDPYAGLVMRAKQGDRQALGDLMRALAPRLRGAARAVFGGDHADVDDLVQESLLAVAGALRSFEGRSTILHYAYRITVRTCLAERRRMRRRQERVQLHESPEGLRSPEAASTENVVAILRRNVLRRLLDELPGPQAETMALRVCLGMSLDEVAQATDAPTNTVRSRMRLARQSLRRQIEDDDEARDLLEGWI
ncbi:MAG: RNA polymerase sigma factor [Myxococcota bacterium]